MIDAALVTRLVATQFPRWADLPVAPVEPGGNDNRTFHLGAGMSVRLPSAAGYVAQVEKEHRWLPVLAAQLPLPVPEPLAIGAPGEGYPWPWSIYRWLDGSPAGAARIDDPVDLARSLGGFLAALQRIDPSDGPAPGAHNFMRGGPLATYDVETRSVLASLADRELAQRASAVWESAMDATWQGPPVWLHGDVAAGNLLVADGRLSAVIDFGCCAVGDPACDLTIAWTLLSGPSREVFRSVLPLDAGTWQRGRGWALWKALITAAGLMGAGPAEVARARVVLDEVLDDHARSS